MSIISSKSNRQKEGFTPYQSDQDLNQKQISLLSKLNLNDHIFQEEPKHEYFFDKYSCDLVGSSASKKRKLSEQLVNIKNSKIGDNNFLNRSLAGKSSLDHSFINELEFGDSNDGMKKGLSENSCPLPLIPDKGEQNLFEGADPEADKPRFTKTKNLLRNLSNYMHKFILYNKRGERWLRRCFGQRLARRRESESVSASNKSSDLSCFQEMCRIEDTPKIQASMMQYIPPSRDESDHLNISTPKGSLEERSLLKEEEEEKEEREEERNESEMKMEDVSAEEQVRAEVKDFQNWVAELSIVNFSDYEGVWSKPHKYRGVYRFICYKYYRSEAICDIYRSRLTTKQISAKYLHQFIEGLLQPAHFYRFK